VRAILDAGSPYRARARPLATAIASEDGMGGLCDTLEGLLDKRAPANALPTMP
jgi:hypothetical protein